MPQQVVLLLRGVLKGEAPTTLAPDLDLSYQMVLDIRHDLQANARQMQPDTPLPDHVTESDEMVQNAGKKVRNLSIRLTHPEVAPTNSADAALMPMTVRPFWAPLAGKPDRCGCG